MTDAKQARKAAQDGIRKLRADVKTMSASLDELHRSATERHEGLVKLQAAVGRIKPKPDRNATVGDNPELRKLLQSSRLAQTTAQYEKYHGEVSAGLSKSGQQRWMLNNLIEMTRISVEQHTGGKPGEAYESRRDTRLIYMALRGLRESSGPLGTAEKAMAKGPKPPRPISEKTPIIDIVEQAQQAKTACSMLDEARAAFDEFASGFEDSRKVAVQGFAEAEKADVA